MSFGGSLMAELSLYCFFLIDACQETFELTNNRRKNCL